MGDTLKGVAEFFETELRESLIARTESITAFRDLGPPDMCHVVKVEKAKANPREVGSYHFISGVDASSSATLAAYLNSLNYLMNDTQGWFGSTKPPQFRISSGVYCCYNIFSRMDVRVEVKIPGGVEAYALDGIRDHRLAVTPAMWTETYISGILRSLVVEKMNPFTSQIGTGSHPNAIYAQILYKISIRHLNPFERPEDEARFLKTAQTCFMRGKTLTAVEDGIHMETMKNPLSFALLNYFQDGFQHRELLEFLQHLNVDDPGVFAMIGWLHACLDDDIAAAKMFYRSQKLYPLQSNELIQNQANWLWKDKQRPDLALELYQFLITMAPTDSDIWIQLAELYGDLNNFAMALITINGSPMLTSNVDYQVTVHTEPESYLHHNRQGLTSMFGAFTDLVAAIPPPTRRHFPLNPDACVPDECCSSDTDPTSKTGTATMPPTVFNDPLMVFTGVGAQRDACDVVLYRLQAPTLRGTYAKAYRLLAYFVSKIGWETLLMHRSSAFVMEDDYKEAQNADASAPVSPEPFSPRNEVQVNEEENRDNVSKEEIPDIEDKTAEHTAEEITVSSPQDDSQIDMARRLSAFSIEHTWKESSALNISLFSKKRVCERWLDNLFLILYEDLRVYNIYKAECNHYKQQKQTITRTPLEWELYGDLCLRLHHVDDALECYENYSKVRYSARVWSKLLQIYLTKKKLKHSLTACEKLLCAQDRWQWGNIIYPSSPVCCAIKQLVFRFGSSKVHTTISEMKFPKRNTESLFRILDWVVQLAS